ATRSANATASGSTRCTRAERSGRLGLDLFRIEARLALRPAGRCGGGFAERLQQHLAPQGANLRQRGGAAERGRQPRAGPGAQQPLVKETIGREAVQLLLGEV